MASDEQLGQLSGLIEAILQGYPGVQKGLQLKNYQTPLDMRQLSNLLQAQQGRDLGLAGRQAGAQAAAYGMNPSSSIQRAQSPIYGQYAEQFTDLPFRLGQYNLAQFEPIFRLLGLKQNIAGQREDSGSAWGQFAGNLLGTGMGALRGGI